MTTALENKTIWLLGKQPFNLNKLKDTYFYEAEKQGLDKVNWEYSQVYYPAHPNGLPQKSCKVSDRKDWILSNKHLLDTADVILCSDPDYFKTLTTQTKCEALVGQLVDSPYVKPKIMCIPSPENLLFNGEHIRNTIHFVLYQCKCYFQSTYKTVGQDIIHSEYYPKDPLSIAAFLDDLHQYPKLHVDIETFDLKITKAGLGSICFTWDEHNGGAFLVDLNQNDKQLIRQILTDFFKSYKGSLVFHKANYDVCVLIYELFMESDITNFIGLHEGLDVLCKNLEDTLVITYLATNNCGGNILGLKQLAAQFAGNWAIDVKDITQVSPEDLLKYNLIDGLCTAYVYKTYYPKMVEDGQEELYKGLFLDTLKTNIYMQLIGMPINLDEVYNLEAKLKHEQRVLIDSLKSTKEIEKAELELARQHMNKRNSLLKTKSVGIDECFVDFNFNSDNHLRTLFYDVLGLPVIDKTDSGLPAVNKNAIKKLKNHTESNHVKKILTEISELTDVNKMLTSFIPAFEQAHVDKNGHAHLIGNFNLCGTVSGRLSSNEPNLHNIPATGSRFAKPIKKCFSVTDDSWIFVGADFSGLTLGEHYSNVVR